MYPKPSDSCTETQTPQYDLLARRKLFGNKVRRSLDEAAVLVVSGMRNLPLELLSLEALLRHLLPVTLVVLIQSAGVRNPAWCNAPRSRKPLWRLRILGRGGGTAGAL
jgi:hypothetical protein